MGWEEQRRGWEKQRRQGEALDRCNHPLGPGSQGKLCTKPKGHDAGAQTIVHEGYTPPEGRTPEGNREYIDIVFDDPPGPVCGRFVECESPAGRSINAGEWIDRGDGLWALRIRSTAFGDIAEGREAELLDLLARCRARGLGSLLDTEVVAALVAPPARRRGPCKMYGGCSRWVSTWRQAHTRGRAASAQGCRGEADE